MSAKVRSLLSVWQSITVATAGGRMASTTTDSSAAPDAEIPWPLAIALSINDFGTPAFLAVPIAKASRGFIFGSGPKTTVNRMLAF